MVHGTTGIDSSNRSVIGEYRPGCIQRVKLQNFFTHGNAEYIPIRRYVVVVSFSFCRIQHLKSMIITHDTFRSFSISYASRCLQTQLSEG